MSNKYSKLEVEILAAINKDIGLQDIIDISEPRDVWLAYSQEKQKDKSKVKGTKRKYYAYRKRERYPRNETAYNIGQEEEFPNFLEYLGPAVKYVLDINMPAGSSFEYYKRLYNGLICLSIKRYFGQSLRRSMGVIRYIVERDFPDVIVPCFKTLDNYQNNPLLSFYLDRVIEATAKPLNKLETRFTTDGTGEATFHYSTWYSIKVGKECKRKDHKIAEVTSTVLLNAAVAVDVLDAEDPNLMVNHIDVVAQSFKIEHWSADSRYLMRELCNEIKSHGGQAHIRIKSNTLTKADGSFEWKRTVILQKKKDEQELDELNLRQNAESTNSAKKRKFGSYTLAVNDSSQINDIKISWACYNFSVLSRAYSEYGIVPEFLTHKFNRCFFRLGIYT